MYQQINIRFSKLFLNRFSHHLRKSRWLSSVRTFSTYQESDFNPKTCGIMRKVTRYEYEKQLNPELSEADLKEHVSEISLFDVLI